MRMFSRLNWLLVGAAVFLALFALVRYSDLLKAHQKLANYVSREVGSGNPDNWTREISDGESVHDRPFKPVVLLQIASEAGQIRGHAIVFNSTDKELSLPAVNSADQPMVQFTAEVSNTATGRWKIMGKSPAASGAHPVM